MPFDRPLDRIAIGSCAALAALLTVAALLYGGRGSFHVLATEVTPTVEVAGLPPAAGAAGRAELADLDRLAGTTLMLLLLGSLTVLATLLGVVSAENLWLQGRRTIEVVLGAPPARLVGGTTRLWLRRIVVALALGALGAAGAIMLMAWASPPGISFARPSPWPPLASLAAVAAVVFAMAVIPVAALYRPGKPLLRQAESQHATDPRPRQFGRVVLITAQIGITVAIVTGSGLLVLARGVPSQGAGVALDAAATAEPVTPVAPAEPTAGGDVLALISPVGGDPSGLAMRYAAALASLRAAPALEAVTMATPGAWIGRGPEVRAINECGRCSTGGMPQPIRIARAKYHAVMPGYFAARGWSFVDGRGFGDLAGPDQTGTDAEGAAGLDGADVAGEVVINEAYARREFRDPPAVGKQVAIGDIGSDWYRVVGVVRDGPSGGLGASGSRYSIYFSTLQHPPAQVEIVASVAGDSADPLDAVREPLASLTTHGLQVDNLCPAQDEIARVYGTARWLGYGSRAAGLLAAGVALTGMIGALRNHVRSRRRELAIRSALGASPARLRRMVLGEAVRISAIGVGLGQWVAMLIVGVVGPPGVPGFSVPLFVVTSAVFISAAVLAALPGARIAAGSDTA